MLDIGKIMEHYVAGLGIQPQTDNVRYFLVAACDVTYIFSKIQSNDSMLSIILVDNSLFMAVLVKRDIGHKILNFVNYNINQTNDVKEVKEYVENTITEMVVRIMNNKILIACGKKRCVQGSLWYTKKFKYSLLYTKGVAIACIASGTSCI